MIINLWNEHFKPFVNSEWFCNTYEYWYVWDLTFTLFKCALSKWITRVSRDASTRREMVHNLTNGVQTTCSRTWIFTFVVYASKAWGTIRVEDAFWSATFIRISNVITNAWTSARTILFSTDCVGAAWTRRAWSWNFNWIILTYFRTIAERIARITSQAITHWCMTNNLALCIYSTSIWTGIFTLLINASQMTGAFWIADTFRFTIRWASDHFW